METYVLTGFFRWESSETLGVFSSFELAKDACCKIPIMKHDEYVVCRAMLDSLESPVKVWKYDVSEDKQSLENEG